MLNRYVVILFLVSTPLTASAQRSEPEGCYTGPIGTAGIGVCRVGRLVGTACEGEILPSAEIVDNEIDEDCNGGLLSSAPCGADLRYDPRSDFAPHRPTVGPIDEYDTRSFGYWRLATWYRPLLVPFGILAVLLLLSGPFLFARLLRSYDWARIQERRILRQVDEMREGQYDFDHAHLYLKKQFRVSKELDQLRPYLLLLQTSYRQALCLFVPTTHLLFGALIGVVLYGVARLVWHHIAGLVPPLDFGVFMTLFCLNFYGCILWKAYFFGPADARNYIDNLRALYEYHRESPSNKSTHESAADNLVYLEEWRQARDD